MLCALFKNYKNIWVSLKYCLHNYKMTFKFEIFLFTKICLKFEGRNFGRVRKWWPAQEMFYYWSCNMKEDNPLIASSSGAGAPESRTTMGFVSSQFRISWTVVLFCAISSLFFILFYLLIGMFIHPFPCLRRLTYFSTYWTRWEHICVPSCLHSLHGIGSCVCICFDLVFKKWWWSVWKSMPLLIINC